MELHHILIFFDIYYIHEAQCHNNIETNEDILLLTSWFMFVICVAMTMDFMLSFLS